MYMYIQEVSQCHYPSESSMEIGMKMISSSSSNSSVDMTYSLSRSTVQTQALHSLTQMILHKNNTCREITTNSVTRPSIGTLSTHYFSTMYFGPHD